MKKTFLILSAILLFFNCTENQQLANCIQNIPVSVSADLNNPQLINAQTPGGFVNLIGGAKGVFLFNIDGRKFVAFDRLCPNRDCEAPMEFEKGLVLKCTCDQSEYSVHFGGAPQTDGAQCPAREYRVVKNGTVIRITNF